MPRKQVELTEILDQFGTRLIRSKEQPNIYRYVPMPKQDIFHQSLTKHRMLMGGNRGGKTFGGIADDVLILTRRHPYREHLYADRPRRLRFIGVDFQEGIDQIALPLFSQLIPPSFLIEGSWEQSYSRQRHMLTLADGSTCSFMSYEQHPNKFQGVSLDHIHMDEEPPKPIFDESVLRVLDTDGSLTISETPVQQLEWLQDEIVEPAEEGRLPNWQVVHLDTRENIHLSAAAVAELEQGMTEEQKIIRLSGRYDTNSSMVFPEFTRKYPNVVSAEAFNPRHNREDWRFARSMDHGLANPTAWLWHAAHRDGSIVTFESRYQAGLTVPEWARIVKEVDREIGLKFFDEPGWQPDICVGDPNIAARNQATGGAASIQGAYAREGINIFTGNIVARRVGNQQFGLNKLHEYLRPRGRRPSALTGAVNEPWWQITENCTPLIDEMKKARKPKQSQANKLEKNTSEEIRDKDNHAIDSVKYYFMSTYELRPPGSFTEDTRSEFEDAFAQFKPTPAAPRTHQEVMEARMSRNREHPGQTSYSDLEE